MPTLRQQRSRYPRSRLYSVRGLVTLRRDRHGAVVRLVSLTQGLHLHCRGGGPEAFCGHLRWDGFLHTESPYGAPGTRRLAAIRTQPFPSRGHSKRNGVPLLQKLAVSLRAAHTGWSSWFSLAFSLRTPQDEKCLCTAAECQSNSGKCSHSICIAGCAPPAYPLSNPQTDVHSVPVHERDDGSSRACAGRVSRPLQAFVEPSGSTNGSNRQFPS
jgi:hypothetical protein